MNSFRRRCEEETEEKIHGETTPPHVNYNEEGMNWNQQKQVNQCKEIEKKGK